MGNFASLQYDVLGRKTSETDFMGNTSSYTYDILGRQLTSTTPFDDNKNAFSKTYYDANGNVTIP